MWLRVARHCEPRKHFALPQICASVPVDTVDPNDQAPIVPSYLARTAAGSRAALQSRWAQLFLASGSYAAVPSLFVRCLLSSMYLGESAIMIPRHTQIKARTLRCLDTNRVQ